MNTGKNLIFLVSQPRTGSTLLQKILGAHPDIHTLSEPWIALHPLFGLRPQGVSANYSHNLALEATSDFLSHLPQGEEAYFEGARRMLPYLYDQALQVSGKSVFLDKSPRYYFIVDELRRTFPDARFVVLIRNPLGVLSSILDTWVKQPFFSNLYSLRIDFVHDLLTAPGAIRTAMKDACSVVHYENLIQNPAATVSRMCKELNVEFHPEMIEYGGDGKANERWAFGDQGTVYREARPVTAPAERWRQTLNGTPAWQEIARSYLHALGPNLITELGYNFDGLCAGLGLRKDAGKVPDLMRVAVLTPIYRESTDFATQLQNFHDTIAGYASEKTSSPVVTSAAGA